MTIEERCPTKLLADTPSEIDSFGGHERIAHAISEVVQTERGGKSIGLEGGWGTGKSTIVNLSSKALTQTKENDHQVVVFDIWAHQGDPLRRTFLQNLIERVQAFGWVDTDKWERLAAEIAMRVREDTTSTTPRLTAAGSAFAITLLGVPLGSALVSAGATLLASNSSSWWFSALLLGFGIFGVFLPAVYYWCAVGRHLWKGTSKIKEGEGRGGLSEIPALVTGQASTESHTTVTQTPDPTSVEFELLFRELLDDALAPPDRKLLLVIDNLDRVQSSDALSIWSTLQTFLGHSDYRRPEWIERLWILIPYDGNAILRLWVSPGNDTNAVEDSATAASFLDKTFQLRFRVPALLLSDWREFLHNALQEAFINHKEEDFHEVYRAFAISCGVETSAPTPRDIKVFVNQIGSLHRIWQHEFPLSYLACYVLLQHRQENIHNSLLSERHLDLPNRIIGDSWRDVIASIHFGAPPQQALQLLLRRPLEVVLANGDGNALSQLASTNPAGFWTVLEDTVPAGAQDWLSVAPIDLGKAANALVSSGLFEQTDARPEQEAIRARIRTAALAVRGWSPFDAVSVQGIVAVAQLLGGSRELMSSLFASISNSRVEVPGSAPLSESVSPAVWMNSALSSITGLIDAGFREHMDECISIPLGAQQWTDVALEVAQQDAEEELLRYCTLRAVEDIDEMLYQRLATNRMDDYMFTVLHITLATTSRNALGKTAKGMLAYLRTGQAIEGDDLTSILTALRVFRSVGLFNPEEYEEFAKGGHYLHHLSHAFSSNHPEAVAECMFGYLEAVPDASRPDRFGNSNAGHNILIQLLDTPDTLAGVVEHFTDLVRGAQHLANILTLASDKDPVPAFVRKTLGTLLTSEDVSKPNQIVRAHWDIIRDVLEEKQEGGLAFEKFLMGLPEMRLLIADIIDDDFSVDDSGLYVSLLKTTGDPVFQAWCERGLSSVSKGAWLKEITSDGGLVALAREVDARETNLTLGVDYFDALVTHAQRVAEDGDGVLTNDTWQDLLGLLDYHQEELFPRRAYEVLKASDGEASSTFFDCFGGMLINRGLLASDPKFIDQVCRPILEESNERGIAWLPEVALFDPDLLAGESDPAAANDFRERVRQHLNDIQEDDPTLPHMRRVAIALGIQNS